MIKFLIILILFLNQSQFSVSVEAYISKELGKYKSFTYEVINLPREINDLNDPLLKIDSERNFKLRKGYAYIPVVVSLGTNEVKSYVTLKVRLFDEVYIATRDIQSGQILNFSDLQIVEKEVTNLYQDPVSINESISNCRASRNIKKDEILQEYMIEKQPVINRGDILTAYFEQATVLVNFQVTAREDGYLKQKIKVIRDDKRIFSAEVIDSQNVLIRE